MLAASPCAVDNAHDAWVQWSMSPKRIRLGIGLAVGGWLLAAVPLLFLGAYAGTVGQCLPAAGPRECGSSAAISIAMVCLAVGPALLGFAAASNKAWAWLATALSAGPVIFVGYDFLTFTYL